MVEITDELFQQYIDEVFDKLPKLHRDNIKNVAILYADHPSPEQRVQLELRNDETLLGLYEGVPLSQRQGQVMTFPDRITLFKGPLTARVHTHAELKTEMYHTLWHEVGHYYGLDHDQIHAREQDML